MASQNNFFLFLNLKLFHHINKSQTDFGVTHNNPHHFKQSVQTLYTYLQCKSTWSINSISLSQKPHLISATSSNTPNLSSKSPDLILPFQTSHPKNFTLMGVTFFHKKLGTSTALLKDWSNHWYIELTENTFDWSAVQINLSQLFPLRPKNFAKKFCNLWISSDSQLPRLLLKIEFHPPFYFYP